jgi:hypothetical protein
MKASIFQGGVCIGHVDDTIGVPEDCRSAQRLLWAEMCCMFTDSASFTLGLCGIARPRGPQIVLAIFNTNGI